MSNKLISLYEKEKSFVSVTVNWEAIHKFNTSEIALGDCGAGYFDPCMGKPNMTECDAQKIKAQSRFTFSRVTDSDLTSCIRAEEYIDKKNKEMLTCW